MKIDTLFSIYTFVRKMYLPSELWLLIFQYTDTETFTNIVNYLYLKNKRFAFSLYGMVCKDAIKYNKKIILMNKIIFNPGQFRKMEPYMEFKYMFNNEDCLKARRRSNFSDIKKDFISYKKFITENYHLCFDSQRDEKLFTNLTKGIYDNDDTVKHNDYLTYYGNRIPMLDIFRHTKDVSLRVPEF